MIALSPEQQRLYNAAASGGNILITGAAGVGKSFLLSHLKQHFKGDLPMTGSTGIAAVAIGGQTLHSWAGLGLADQPADKIAQYLLGVRSAACKRILKAQRLVIDEISMVHCELLTLVDMVFRIVRDNPKPFGGIQLILSGDFCQLPPISKSKGKIFAFQSDSWSAAEIHVGMLTKVFRQKDQAFADALNDVRVGNLTSEVKTLLRSRYRQHDPFPEIAPVIVYTHNADVDGENAKKLAELPGDTWTREAQDSGQEGPLATLQKNCLAPATLNLKIGAQVMLLWNIDPLNDLANGSLGKITGFSRSGEPIVKFSRMEMAIETRTWAIKSGDDVLAARVQFPLRLAWAATVHKTQGMTLDKVRVYLDRVFEYGQAYVALSRSKTLEGLFIESTAPGCIRAHPEAVKFYRDNTPE